MTTTVMKIIAWVVYTLSFVPLAFMSLSPLSLIPENSDDLDNSKADHIG